MADEIKCEACDGSGERVIKHPSEPKKRIVVRCKVCNGKGRLKKPVE